MYKFGQNPDRITAFASWYARNMTRIAYTFLEKGHAEMENDFIHVTIECHPQNRTLHTRAMVCCCKGPTHLKTKLNISFFFSICFPVCLFKVPKGFPLGTGPFLLTKIYGSQYREMIAAYVIHYFDICYVVDIG